MVNAKTVRCLHCLTVMTTMIVHQRKERNIFYLIKTWKWYSYKNHTIKLQCLRHKMHLFYIHYLQWEITKLSIGFQILVSLTIPHNTHQWFQWDTLIHVNMHMIWNTHTLVSFWWNLKHTQDAHIWNAVRVNMYSGCWCWNRNSFDLYRWPNITCTYSNSTQKWNKKNIIYRYLMFKNSQITVDLLEVNSKYVGYLPKN